MFVPRCSNAFPAWAELQLPFGGTQSDGRPSRCGFNWGPSGCLLGIFGFLLFSRNARRNPMGSLALRCLQDTGNKAACSVMQVNLIYNLQQESWFWWFRLSYVSRPHGQLLRCLVKSEHIVQCRIAPFTADSFSIWSVELSLAYGIFLLRLRQFILSKSCMYEVSQTDISPHQLHRIDLVPSGSQRPPSLYNPPGYDSRDRGGWQLRHMVIILSSISHI